LRKFSIKNQKKRMALYHPFFLWLILLLPLPAWAETGVSAFTTPLQQAYQEILKLKVGAGRRLLQEELRLQPRNLAALLIEDYPDFLKLVVTQDPALYSATLAAQEARLEKIRESTEKSPYRLFAQAEIKIHMALCQFLFQDEFKGAWNIRQAFLLLEQNQKLYPDFYPNRKSLGLLQFALGSVPDSYHWILSLLGMKADVKAGIRNIRLAAIHPHPFQAEANLLFYFLDDVLHREEAAPLAYFIRQARSQPDNLLFSFMAVSLLQKRKRCDEALAFFHSRPEGKAYLPFTFMHHMAADMYLFRGDYNKSVAENNLFLSLYPGRHYVKDAWYKMYLASWMQRDLTKAGAYLKMVGQQGDTFAEEDANALRAYQKNQPINFTLMKARLHTDGGYFRLAEQTLASLDLNKGLSTKDKIEYFYRQARVHHGLQNLAPARNYYKKTLELSGDLPYYFAPNAALQLGYMALEDHNVAEARYYFKKALAYPRHDYKRSIDSKAKVALVLCNETINH
jgi:hypothetical protein